jgi:hypothetical protein
MDFIERWFGVFPDGGNGSLEAVYLLTAIAALFVVGVCRHARHRVLVWSRRHDPLR